MKLVNTASYSQVLIASVPIVRHCDQCCAQRQFRLLAHYQFRHVAFIFRWDYEEDLVRICGACNHAFRISLKEVRQVLPTYQPLASKSRRRLVQLVFLVPVVLYVVAWNLSRYFEG